MHSCYKIKDKHFGTLDGTCKTCKICKHIHATKSKTKNISTESTLTQISTESSWRFLPKKNQHVFFDAFTCEDIDFVENMNFPCQGYFLWKVLDFVEGNILVWRADIDLLKIFLVPDLGALY